MNQQLLQEKKAIQNSIEELQKKLNSIEMKISNEIEALGFTLSQSPVHKEYEYIKVYDRFEIHIDPIWLTMTIEHNDYEVFENEFHFENIESLVKAINSLQTKEVTATVTLKDTFTIFHATIDGKELTPDIVKNEFIFDYMLNRENIQITLS
jgi:predicted transcriptional regulator YdeE